MWHLLLFFAAQLAHRLVEWTRVEPRHPPFVAPRGDVTLSEENWALWESEYARLRDAVQYREYKRRHKEMRRFHARAVEQVVHNRRLLVDLVCVLMAVCLFAYDFATTEVPQCHCECPPVPVAETKQCELAAPPPPTETMEERSVTALVLGLSMPACTHATEPGYCYALHKQPLVSAPPAERRYFVDEYGQHYFTVLQQGLVSLVHARRLQEQLQALPRVREDRCVCADQLDAVRTDRALAFLHSGGAWHLMPDPQVVRNTTGARMVRNEWPDLPDALEHYESFTVEFAEFASAPLDDAVRVKLTEYNNRLAVAYPTMFILRCLDASVVARVRLTLVDSDAACFTYCRQRHASPSL